MSNSNDSENTKWLKYGVSRVRNCEIDELIQDRLYLVDTHSESPTKEVNEQKHPVGTTKSVKKKCRALSKKLQPLNDKFDTDYAALELIGSGNFGQVFKAKNNRNGKICAVKKSKNPFVSYKDRRAKEEEIRKWSIITNQYKQSQSGASNCLELYEAWEENGYLYSSSEYCENGNFAEWLRSRSIKLSKKEMYKCILDMALAIKQVHDCNIVHMDIKPDNFLVKADNTIKLGDFGLAVDLRDLEDGDSKVEDVNTSMRKRKINVSEGDASYIAPELLSFNVKVTKKVDVFSFGL
jgi:mitosis inhibitor protein kinase SWE1